MHHKYKLRGIDNFHRHAISVSKFELFLCSLNHSSEKNLLEQIN